MNTMEMRTNGTIIMRTICSELLLFLGCIVSTGVYLISYAIIVGVILGCIGYTPEDAEYLVNTMVSNKVVIMAILNRFILFNIAIIYNKLKNR